MLSFVSKLAGPALPISFFEVQTSEVDFGYLEPVTDPPVLVGIQKFDESKKVVVIHVPNLAVLEQLVASPAVAWSEGSTKAKADAKAGAFKWPSFDGHDYGVPIIVGGEAPEVIP